MENQTDKLNSFSAEKDTIIFYYTGTGNSLWVARSLAEQLGDAQVISMVKWNDNRQEIKPSVIGLVFPVHIWGVPRRVLEFLIEVKKLSPDYIFAVATNGGQVANTLVQLKRDMYHQGLVLNSGWSIELPSNYIPWGGPGSAEEQQKLFCVAQEKIPSIADRILKRVQMQVEKGPWWHHMLFTPIYKMTYNMVPQMAGKFWADDRCDQCTLCVKVCPAHNLTLQNGSLVWDQQCEQCLACLQWCPQQALQYGKKTSAYERYHHPEIKLKDMIK